MVRVAEAADHLGQTPEWTRITRDCRCEGGSGGGGETDEPHGVACGCLTDEPRDLLAEEKRWAAAWIARVSR